MPKVKNDDVQQIVRVLSKLSTVESILLLGSAARGELSIRVDHQGRIERFSDYEFLLVTSKRPTPDQRRALAMKIEELECQISNPNPLFHIDTLIREQSRLHSLPRLIFTFEMKQNAKICQGVDVRPEIPDVTLENLNYRNTHEILYKRLWAILLHLPKRFILGDLSEAERRVTGYILCRNALDITTVLLPHENVLLPTYRQRVEFLVKHYREISFQPLFGPGLPHFMETCLQRRLDLDFSNIDLVTLYNNTITYLQAAITYLLPVDMSIQALPDISQSLFNEWPISRGEWYNLAKVILWLLKSRGPNVVWPWLRTPKKGWLTVGLLDMHRALIAWFEGDMPAAQQSLENALTALSQISLTSVVLPATAFPEQWLHLRQQWSIFWQAYIRLGDPKYAQRFEFITEWHHD